jgi:uncharacterized membrane protein YkvA (DUF1232 family)
MPNSSKNIVPSGNFLHELALRIKLILRLMGDKRVSPLVKAIPVVSLLYLINPIDIPTPIDDAAVLGLGVYLFMELCPQEVVAEHMQNLRNLKKADLGAEPEIVDGEFEVDQSNDAGKPGSGV